MLYIQPFIPLIYHPSHCLEWTFCAFSFLPFGKRNEGHVSCRSYLPSSTSLYIIPVGVSYKVVIHSGAWEVYVQYMYSITRCPSKQLHNVPTTFQACTNLSKQPLSCLRELPNLHMLLEADCWGPSRSGQTGEKFSSLHIHIKYLEVEVWSCMHVCRCVLEPSC